MCHQTVVDWWDLTLRFAVVLVAFLILAAAHRPKKQ
jgi:hypothetical protein